MNWCVGFIICTSLVSCGTYEQPPGKVRNYTDLSKRQLYVLPGKDEGFCVYADYGDEDKVLITERGALSAEQLGQALSYMSYWSQTASSSLPQVATGYAIVSFLKQTTAAFEKKKLNRVKLLRLIGAAALVIGAAHAVNGLYRIVKGNYEGESAGAITAQVFFGFMPVNFVIENMQRRGRLETLASPHAHSTISARKFDRIVKKLAEQKPAFPHAAIEGGRVVTSCVLPR